MGDLVAADNEDQLRTCCKALTWRKGVRHLMAPLVGLKGEMLAGTPTRRSQGEGVFHQARLPPAAPATRARPRIFTQQQARLWVVRGPGIALTKEQRKAYDVRCATTKQGREQSFPSEKGNGRRGHRTVPAQRPRLKDGLARRSLLRRCHCVIASGRGAIAASG